MTGCWEWTGNRNDEGYGRLWLDGRRVYAHRRSWELFMGPIPPGLCVLHRCDNPPCCNPEHLFIGTKGDNMRDAMSKGRAPRPPRLRPEWAARGERSGTAKLTESAVRSIRAALASGESMGSVARRIGVGHGTVHAIAVGRTWRHVLPLLGGVK